MQLSLEKLPILEQFLLSEEPDWLANSKSKERRSPSSPSRHHQHPQPEVLGPSSAWEGSAPPGNSGRTGEGIVEPYRKKGGGESLRLDKFLTAGEKGELGGGIHLRVFFRGCSQPRGPAHGRDVSPSASFSSVPSLPSRLPSFPSERFKEKTPNRPSPEGTVTPTERRFN